MGGRGGRVQCGERAAGGRFGGGKLGLGAGGAARGRPLAGSPPPRAHGGQRALCLGGSVRQVLRQYSINLSEEEFFHILEYYDKTLSSKISYNDFLRAFLQ